MINGKRSFSTGYPASASPAFSITNTSGAACVRDIVSEWLSTARGRVRSGYHGA
jgi:hypothetical protein